MMDLTFQQHRFLKQLEKASEAVPLKGLKPKTGPADRTRLVEAKLVEQRKQGGQLTFTLSDAGRRLLAQHPDAPQKVKAKQAPRPPKPPSPVPVFPSPVHRLFMLKLAFARPGEAVEGLSKVVSAAERARLVERKWVEVHSIRPSLRCELTDAGWRWVEEHLGDGVGGNPAGDVLGAVLARVDAFLGANDMRLADLLRAKSTVARSVTSIDNDRGDDEAGTHAGASRAAGNIADVIRAACGRLAHNSVSPHVMLADLRPALAAWDRRAVDEALLELALAGRVKLVGMDDPREIQPRDREAELRTPAGEPRHLLYWIGS